MTKTKTSPFDLPGEIAADQEQFHGGAAQPAAPASLDMPFSLVPNAQIVPGALALLERASMSGGEVGAYLEICEWLRAVDLYFNPPR